MTIARYIQKRINEIFAMFRQQAITGDETPRTCDRALPLRDEQSLRSIVDSAPIYGRGVSLEYYNISQGGGVRRRIPVSPRSMLALEDESHEYQEMSDLRGGSLLGESLRDREHRGWGNLNEQLSASFSVPPAPPLNEEDPLDIASHPQSFRDAHITRIHDKVVKIFASVEDIREAINVSAWMKEARERRQLELQRTNESWGSRACKKVRIAVPFF